MKIAKSNRTRFKDNQITDEHTFNNRRQLLKQFGLATGAASLFPTSASASLFDVFGGSAKKSDPMHALATLKTLQFTNNPKYASSETLTPLNKVASHNNFYEFGTSKSDPIENAQNFKVNPWQLTVEGLVDNPIKLNFEDLFTRFTLEERVYRLRCVEAWSMVVPWVGFELSKLIAAASPKSNAKYVAFETLYDPKQMPGQASRLVGGGIDYPYVEGLRLDEAMNSLTIMAVGLYGKALPNQNGAPVRLVVPWKYGFKSIKSVTTIRLTDKEPPTTWNILAPQEYGFYANVNPAVDHPRWSQKRERRITAGGLLNQTRIDTQAFNGYGEQVAHLYKDMNLTRLY